MSFWKIHLLLLLLCLWLHSTVLARGISATGELVWNLNGTEIQVFTYYPSDCNNPSLLFVFHGLNRKAESLRNKAMDIAQEACLVVFAPLFDKERFPNWRYHRAGVVRDGVVQPRSQWTGPIVQELLDFARRQVSNPEAKLYLFGHSAGGQFLSRLSAYSPPTKVNRIVIANPSVYVAPLFNEAAPYGFKGVFSSFEEETALKAYLALPITIYLGQKDTGKKNLLQNAQAMRQGQHRLERGRNIFQMAKGVAMHKGWPFNWRLIEVPEVGHSSRGMLGHSELIRAIGLDPNPPKIVSLELRR